MTDRELLAIMKDDKLTLPNKDGVETSYIVDRIEGTPFEAIIHLKSANGIPGDTRTITYGRTD